MTIPRPLQLATALTAIIQCACVEPSSPASGTTTVDSNGVAIVTSLQPQTPDTIRIERENLSVTLGNKLDTPLLQVRGAVRLSDGTIVIANAGFDELLFFDSVGTLRHRAGGHGGGPGEFLGPSGMTNIWLTGTDTVAAWEHGRSRLSLFGPNGSYVGGIQITPGIDAFPLALGMLAGQRIVALHSQDRRPRRAGELYRDTLRFVVYSQSGGTWVLLDSLPGYERFGFDFQGRLTMGRRPFPREPVSVVSESRFYHSSGDRFEIKVYEGLDVSQVIRRREDDRRVHPEHIAAEVTRLMADAPADPAMRRGWQRAVEEAPYPDEFPAIRRLLLDPMGRLWVQAYEHPLDSLARWSIFAPDGEWLAEARVPIALRLLDVGEFDVIAVWRDENDIERLGLFGYVLVGEGP